MSVELELGAFGAIIYLKGVPHTSYLIPALSSN